MKNGQSYEDSTLTSKSKNFVRVAHGSESPDYVMESTDERKAIDNHIKKDRISNIGVDSTAETDATVMYATVIPGSTTGRNDKERTEGEGSGVMLYYD